MSYPPTCDNFQFLSNSFRNNKIGTKIIRTIDSFNNEPLIVVVKNSKIYLNFRTVLKS